MVKFTACLFGSRLVVDADLLCEKSTTDWWLIYSERKILLGGG
jgi:hypothetical protein